LAQGVEGTGLLAPLGRFVASRAVDAPESTALVAGGITAMVCNLVNNLPLGLIVGTLATGSHLTSPVTAAMLIGVDIGPNLSVTGTLATFLSLGVRVMPPALLVSLWACNTLLVR
jgi:arsenical pump membrane protein